MEIKGATLLSTEEAKELLTKKDRVYKSGWWLRSPGFGRYLAVIVSSNGSIRSRGLLVDYAYYCVRPALLINLESSDHKIGETFMFEDKTFKIISDELAFCLDDIGRYYFRND